MLSDFRQASILNEGGCKGGSDLKEDKRMKSGAGFHASTVTAMKCKGGIM